MIQLIHCDTCDHIFANQQAKSTILNGDDDDDDPIIKYFGFSILTERERLNKQTGHSVS